MFEFILTWAAATFIYFFPRIYEVNDRITSAHYNKVPNVTQELSPNWKVLIFIPARYVLRQGPVRRKIFSKLRTAVYPPNMAPIGAKLCQNAFQVIPDISFFDAHKHFWRQKFLSEKFFVNTPKIFSTKCLFWRSCAGLHATIECSSKIHCQTCRFQPSTTLGGGVKREKTVFFRSFDQKTDLIPPPRNRREIRNVRVSSPKVCFLCFASAVV